MLRQALSLSKKQQIDHDLYKECMTKAVALYQYELEKGNSKEWLGLCKVCSVVEKEFLCEEGVHVNLNHNTLNWLIKGGTL